MIAYREIRRLERETLEALYPRDPGSGLRQGFTDLGMLAMVDVGQFHGIELEEFPARIAEVAMWMADHLANRDLAAAFSRTFARIPLRQSANIRGVDGDGDALAIDWNDVLPAAKCSYVMGNPPFVGAKFQSAAQREQVRAIAGLGGTGGTLDFVAAWFIKAVAYLGPSQSRIAFVATNSICQGEQVAQLWPLIFRAGYEIAFGHRSFIWDSEARGKAHVHVVIVGLAHRDAEPTSKRLFSYDAAKGTAAETRHAALTAYLFEARTMASRHLVVANEARPINGARRLITGTQPIDGDLYKFTSSQRQAFLEQEPRADPLIKPYIGAEEFINAGSKWILDLRNCDPVKLAKMPAVLDRMRRVTAWRTASPRVQTQSIAQSPTLYGISVVPEAPFLVIPQVSSERRDYTPIAWLKPPVIPSEKLRILTDATPWEFGILTSRMHMAWMRAITGRMKSDYMYSVGVVYNTFPWPSLTDAKCNRVATLADAVLAARANHSTASLAILYDPMTMPADLRAAHTALDRAVDRLYRAEAFGSDRDRVEHLFGRYAALIDPLMTTGAKLNRKVGRRSHK